MKTNHSKNRIAIAIVLRIKEKIKEILGGIFFETP